MLVPLQVILIAVAMVAFNQEWHVEEERPIGDEMPPVEPPADDDAGGGEDAPAAPRRGSGRAPPARTGRATHASRTAARRPRKA